MFPSSYTVDMLNAAGKDTLVAHLGIEIMEIGVDFILAKMPVTPVGKIFKPALKIMEIEAVVKQEAKKLNVKLQVLEVIQHRELGLLARISAPDNIDVLAESLGRYTFECEIV